MKLPNFSGQNYKQRREAKPRDWLNPLSLRQKMIAHLVKKAWFERFAEAEFYESETLGEEGFIHCCEVADVDEIRNRYFIGESEILTLLLNPDLIAASIKYEPGFGQKLFPHIYGPLNKSAIMAIKKLEF